MLSPVGLQTRPLSPAILGLAAREQLVKTTTELIIADAVRRWTNEVMPNEPAAADAAAVLAVRCYSGGASVGEACQEARRFVGSWSRHPSHRSSSHGDLQIAS